jgi:hypothetical protein
MRAYYVQAKNALGRFLALTSLTLGLVADHLRPQPFAAGDVEIGVVTDPERGFNPAHHHQPIGLCARRLAELRMEIRFEFRRLRRELILID